MSAPRNLWANRLRTDFQAALGMIVALACIPLFVSSPYLLGIVIVSMYFAMLAMGWNLLAGFTGQFSLAPAAFAMLGAYTTGLLNFHLKTPLALGLPAAVLATAFIGWVLGRLILRLRGPYLALTTLSFAEIARVVISNSYEFTRGDRGLNVPTLMQSRLGYYYLFLAVLVFMLIGLYLLMRSKVGRFWLAIRDDSIGAETRGIDVVRYKTLAFALSCAMCGFAGALYGTFSQLVSPELGLLLQTGLVISMVVIGGIGTLSGPILGALLVYLSSEWLREIGGVQLIVFSALVILFARFFRTGIWGLITTWRPREKSKSDTATEST
ncbi:branched-chain amino acid ABC transporter permease [Actimicrobium sp. CCI2.3]|uniref:branched-chain amino acid ABC transporter permease n=1 Tax=Actimicrobium sp. CCI2.3 TaxID=3048616 RepID=UPI002AB500AB|nr:branched-chain amino acid ABC transporter permease [Actimicrobium sp. CCI2.3]MDY7573047.1 branched-chain amino acid ABC transporter permease [Actimicrobium sp. CCI2.3]MEB0020845.1 branched-chain amino acid ABC transporter permease [Actimicrobium sp. CCI2.3]